MTQNLHVCTICCRPEVVYEVISRRNIKIMEGNLVIYCEVASSNSFRDIQKNHFVTAAAEADIDDCIKRNAFAFRLIIGHYRCNLLSSSPCRAAHPLDCIFIKDCSGYLRSRKKYLELGKAQALFTFQCSLKQTLYRFRTKIDDHTVNGISTMKVCLPKVGLRCSKARKSCSSNSGGSSLETLQKFYAYEFKYLGSAQTKNRTSIQEDQTGASTLSNDCGKTTPSVFLQRLHSTGYLSCQYCSTDVTAERWRRI